MPFFFIVRMPLALTSMFIVLFNSGTKIRFFEDSDISYFAGWVEFSGAGSVAVSTCDD